MIVKLVNVSGEEKRISIRVEGKETDECEGKVTMLAGEKQAVNSFGRETVHPAVSEIRLDEGNAEIVLPPFCAVVIEWP